MLIKCTLVQQKKLIKDMLCMLSKHVRSVYGKYHLVSAYVPCVHTVNIKIKFQNSRMGIWDATNPKSMD